MTDGRGPYELRLASRASDYLDRVDERTRSRLKARLDQIANSPYGPQTKPLTNRPGLRSARVGDLRIIFSVDSATQIVDVDRIGPRGQIYRGL